ncbi:S-adenosyl-L-methionine-dependent methyltransferase [Lineolata rhizophorae]|uniref:S-adenosyl-L-methionine-dependent methyltransferase n=1 Tax=Lineolata rhizophorae TaxID=578093 RepID=A0A6A6NZC6_9PEZI|nr:S-adenosyl-L-methionine-dependent methyltransferase [Lineolata rhizophorae]
MDPSHLRGEQYEDEHVHEVYEQIASHFSSTRYKPWPIVERFISTLHPGSVGLDIGCGNGKYLTVNPDIFILASDRSPNLVRIASTHNRPHVSLAADVLSLPHPLRTFDFALSIAVVHHLSTRERRINAIEAILAMLRPPWSSDKTVSGEPGRALIFVWALEQKSSRRGWDEGDDQDVLVPWVVKGGSQQQEKSSRMKQRKGKKGTRGSTMEEQVPQPDAETKPGPRAPSEVSSVPESEGRCNDKDSSKTYQRYYHLYRKGELEEDIETAGGTVLESGYERDNWWAICAPSMLNSYSTGS